jgi:hypothetical protein
MLKVFEKGVLRRILGPKREEKLHIPELHNL